MLDVTIDEGIALVRLTHGPMNAMDTALCRGLARKVADLAARDEVRAIVLTGNGRAFGAGVDLKAFLDLDAAGVRDFLDALGEVLLAPVLADVPVVTAVDGHAIAGGAILALAGDVMLVTDDPRVRLGLTELAVGVPFPPVPIELVRDRLPTMAPVLTAALYGPDEAVAVGLGTRVVPADTLVDAALAEARRLAAVPATTFVLTKQALRRSMLLALEGRDDDQAAAADAWASDDVRAAIQRFLAAM